MVRHIVWWTLKPEAEGRTAAENAKLIKQRLEALMGQIPSLKSLEVSYDFLPTCTMPVNVTTPKGSKPMPNTPRMSPSARNLSSS